jgi:cytochrome P450
LSENVAKLPPGPPMPKAMQTLGWWARPLPFFERCRQRYGTRFTMKLLQTPPFVHISDPADVKDVFQADPAVLHPGEGAKVLEPIVGRHSLILLDEQPHLEQRKLMLPAFHGEKMQKLTGVMRDVAEQEADSWHHDEPVALHPRLQALTLEIILRAVFGLDEGERLDALRAKLTRILELGARPTSMLPAVQKSWNPEFREFAALREECDALIFGLVDERRASEAERDDVLSMFLSARHSDGSPMSDQELRDELMTLLVAGHETTASELAWAFERLPREPAVLKRLVEAVDGEDEAYIVATVQEVLRSRPVLPNAEPRLVMEEIEIGGWRYPTGCCLAVNAYLVHHDPAIYPDPYAFRPERFLDESPGTYTWLPFGGGRRRCIGASFAMLEMQIALRAVLERHTIASGNGGGPELTRRRSITISPNRGARTIVTARTPAREPATAA